MKKVKNDRTKYVTRASLVTRMQIEKTGRSLPVHKRDFGTAPIDGAGYVTFSLDRPHRTKEKA